MKRSGASTVRVYDGTGALIATIDPVSRERELVAPAVVELDREIEALKQLRAFKLAVKDMDPVIDESSDEFRAGVIFITLLTTTGDLAELVRFTGFQSSLIEACCARWRENGICDQDHVIVKQIMQPLTADDETEQGEDCVGRSAVTFWLCVSVGLGSVRYDPQTDKWRAAEAT